MQKVVVDSSVIVKWLNQQDEERIIQADKILMKAQNSELIIFTSELAKYEIGNALLIHKELSPEDASGVFENFFNLPIQCISHSPALAKETYVIARKEKITFYDASFIALAKQENAVLITDNPKHQGKTKKIPVVSLADY
jgi:predicted nucleic acid-binding protein